MKICFASHNENKVKEMNKIMPESISILSLNDLGLEDEIAETGDSLEENSHIKAQYVFDKKGLPVFADDSGLVVKALNGEPGVYSARYAGPEKDDEKNMNLLLDRLESHMDRSAEFQTVITYISPEGAFIQFKGAIEGTITNEKKGLNGFGYDPIFQPRGYDETFAELPQEEKNKISHRAKALKKLLDHLQKHHG
ncbi:RdgB/HAM1 family non-canonical purine NTP pyrophosphatase [Ekhidna sp. To15]|uniref:RdgB/HAM1 family non-canonical purine NTP pyrophosphatase n=1 Tax=Ekhidna sp. To15 TaxID=3395267 RepID=UPI003F527CBC